MSYLHYRLTVWWKEDSADLICRIGNEESEKEVIYDMWAGVHPIYRQALAWGGMPLHAALASLDGMGVLFAAPGGTGKTTVYRMLPNSWTKLGDDEALILPTRNGYHAHPFPTWSNFLVEGGERVWKVQEHVPVRAVFFLEQAYSDAVTRLGQGHSAVMVNQSARQIMRRGWGLSGPEIESRLKRRLFDNCSEFAREIPAFLLQFTRDGSFWTAVEAVLADLPAQGNRPDV